MAKTKAESVKSLDGNRVLLIVGGGIAAYKCLELIRRLRERGVAVRVIATKAALEFVTPLSLSTLAGTRAHTDLFDLTDEMEIGHIQLARDTDLVVVAPATANLIAKMANGIADDLASTALLATDRPALVAPAMNTRMWRHAATRRNMAVIAKDGAHVVGPNDGPLAEGESGPGRMAEPDEILEAITGLLTAEGPLTGIKALVTSGPTHEPIDPVRYLANRSSGKQGHAAAAALARLGAEVTLVTGPVTIADPRGVNTVHVASAREMLAACETALPADVAVCAAAVADWRPEKEVGQKIKKNAQRSAAELSLIENPDILAMLSKKGRSRPALVIGFAAETEKLIEHATAKLKKKGCDWMVANDVSEQTGVMGGEENTVHLITARGKEAWPKMTKAEVARQLAARIAAHLAPHAKAAE